MSNRKIEKKTFFLTEKFSTYKNTKSMKYIFPHEIDETKTFIKIFEKDRNITPGKKADNTWGEVFQL